MLHRLQSCDGKNLREISSLRSCIRKIRNVWNQEWIDKGLKDSILNMPESGVAAREILEVTESFAYPQILFLDHTNTGISQVLEYLGNVKYMFQFFFQLASFYEMASSPGSFMQCRRLMEKI